MTLSEELAWRGFINQTTFEDITVLDKDPITFYWGVDPSANSMHIGQLALAMMIWHFIRAGHKPILLVGGATGLIGDPDGKESERELKSAEEVQENKDGIKKQYVELFKNAHVELVDNYDWFKDLGYLEFLRSIGKHVPMSQMLGREFIQTRLGEGGSGISYAEFSYALIQAYDFLYLYRTYGATLQICGSDQWGNSIAGVELIRRIEGAEAHIWSAPLIVNKTTGRKFGKSESGTVWLDERKTSPYQFYQFWLNTDDESAIEYLKLFTMLEKSQIDEITEQFDKDKSGRLAQKTLAYEVTKIVHEEARAESVKRISEVLFGGLAYNQLQLADFKELAHELMVIDNASRSLVDILVAGSLASSKTEARRFLESNAIYINGSQIPLEKLELDESDSLHGYAVVRRGKNSQILYKF